MVRIGEEVLARHRVHPVGTLVDEGRIQWELVDDPMDVAVPDSPDPVPSLLDREPLGIVVCTVPEQEPLVSVLDVLLVLSTRGR